MVNRGIMSESDIDTSKMSEGKAAALEIAEAGRDKLNKNFAGDLFFGDADFNKIYPYPTSTNTKESTTFLLKVDNDSIGYDLEADDEILAIGKFNS